MTLISLSLAFIWGLWVLAEYLGTFNSDMGMWFGIFTTLLFISMILFGGIQILQRFPANNGS